MFQRLKIAFLLLQVMNTNENVHRPAMERLSKIGKPVVKRVLNGASQAEAQPKRVAATITKPDYQSALNQLPAPEATKELVRFLENLANQIRRSSLIRDRFGTILANIGADAWTIMLDTAQRLPDSSYTQAAYFIMPQFVNRLPWETFMEAALNHPVEAIRNQATICVQKYDVPQTILQKLADKTDHALLQAEQRYPNLLQTAVRTMRQMGQPGTDAIFACWHSSDTNLKQAAIAEMRFVTDASLFDHFIEAIKSADAAIHRGGIIGLFDLAEYLSPQQQSLAIDILIPILNTETFDNTFTAIEVLAKCKDVRAIPAIQAVQRRHIRHSYPCATCPHSISPIRTIPEPLQYKTSKTDLLFRKRLKAIIHSLSEKNNQA